MNHRPSNGAMPTSPIGQLYTTMEVAKMLRVSQRTVERWIQRGALPAMQYGTVKRIREEDVMAFGMIVPTSTMPCP